MDPAFLTAMPDGRLLFAESGARVRVIVNQALIDEPALALPGNARIVGITLDRDFSTSRAVFIAWTERTRNESEVLNISRYREVANTLGESAVIVTGLPFRSDGVAPVTVGADGLLYVAVPSGSSARAAAEPGLVLRFTRDGHIPKDNPNALPVIAAGYARPTGMAIDPVAGRIWIAGESPEWVHNIATLAMFDDQRPRWRVTPADHHAPAEQFRSATLAFTQAGNSGAAKLMIATMSRLYEAAIEASGTMSSVREIVFENNLAVLAIAPSAQDTLYVAVRDVAGSSAIVQMRAQ